jgi:hypothetical protein
MTSALFKQIEDLIPGLDGWCGVQRACEFASLIVGMRPETTAELGVWGGRCALAMALAHKHNGYGRVIAIDPWSAAASVEGQAGEDQHWWNDQAKHDLVYGRFMDNVARLGVENFIHIERKRSDDVTLDTDSVSVLAIDANHGEQAIQDVKRYSPAVPVGGWIFMDDMGWAGGSVWKAGEILKSTGFVEKFQRDQGMWFQRLSK